MWTYIKSNSGMGLQEQWIRKVDAAPAISLKRDGAGWVASLLDRSGISVVTLDIDDMTLDEAKRACECVLRGMGWEVTNV